MFEEDIMKKCFWCGQELKKDYVSVMINGYRRIFCNTECEEAYKK